MSNEVGQYDMTIPQGIDFSRTFTIRENSVLIPSAGFSARAEIRNTRKPDAPLVVAFTCTFDADGVVVISLTNTQTKALLAGSYVYDLETYADAGGSVVRRLEGEITVTPNVTRE